MIRNHKKNHRYKGGSNLFHSKLFLGGYSKKNPRDQMAKDLLDTKNGENC